MMKNTSSHQLKSMILKAIDDHVLTREEYDMIIHLATEDGHVDRHEQALLDQLQEMIENKTVKLKAK